jgi:hypothetical protein
MTPAPLLRSVQIAKELDHREKRRRKMEHSRHCPDRTRRAHLTLDPKTHRIYLLAAEYGAPAAKSGEKQERLTVLPDSFHVLVVGQ